MTAPRPSSTSQQLSQSDIDRLMRGEVQTDLAGPSHTMARTEECCGG